MAALSADRVMAIDAANEHGLAALLGVLALVGTIVSGLWKVLARPFVWAFDALFFSAVDRNEERTKARWARLFAPEMGANAHARSIAADTARDVGMLRDSIGAVGKTLETLPQLAQNVGIMARELGNVTEALQEVVRDQRTHGESIVRLDERVAAWDGRERRERELDDPRQHERRKRLPRKPVD